MKIRYEERPPSPQSRKEGVALELAVLSEPSCRFRPHVPSSNCTTFVVRANDEPAKTTIMARPARTTTPKRRETASQRRL
jgi:hypothetical protein